MSNEEVKKIQAQYEAGELTREDYKEKVAAAEGRPSYKASRQAQNRVVDDRRLEELEKELHDIRQRRAVTV